MKWVISHQSALEFWRKTSTKDAFTGNNLRILKLPATPLTTRELLTENFWNLTVPLHVLVSSDNVRKRHRYLQCHICSGEFPNGSFRRLGSGLVVSSPELCFLQMASVLSFIDLVSLGYELCGSYRLIKEKTTGQEELNKGFRNDLALTSVAKLNSYAMKAVNLKGCKNARRALIFIIDGSASPMETILTMLLTLPYRFGGFGLPYPLLNFGIDIPQSASDSKSIFPVIITISSTGSIHKSKNVSDNKTKYYCDLYWPDKKVALEYDSDEYHTGSSRIEKDAIRRNALASAGVTVITASRRQVSDAGKLHELAEVISKLLGKRIRNLDKEFSLKQVELLNQLYKRVSFDM